MQRGIPSKIVIVLSETRHQALKLLILYNSFRRVYINFPCILYREKTENVLSVSLKMWFVHNPGKWQSVHWQLDSGMKIPLLDVTY